MPGKTDHDAMRLLTTVRALARRLAVVERLDAACCAVTVPQIAALEALAALGPLRPGDLGAQLGVTPSTLTRNVFRLEAAGLLERRPDPADARAQQIALTRSGRAALSRATTRSRAFAAAVFARLPAERRAAVADAVTDLMNAIQAATEGCCPGAFGHLIDDARAARPTERKP